MGLTDAALSNSKQTAASSALLDRLAASRFDACAGYAAAHAVSCSAARSAASNDASVRCFRAVTEATACELDQLQLQFAAGGACTLAPAAEQPTDTDVLELEQDKNRSPPKAAMHTTAESESLRDATMLLAGWELVAWWEWGLGAAGGDRQALDAIAAHCSACTSADAAGSNDAAASIVLHRSQYVTVWADAAVWVRLAYREPVVVGATAVILLLLVPVSCAFGVPVLMQCCGFGTCARVGGRSTRGRGAGGRRGRQGSSSSDDSSAGGRSRRAAGGSQPTVRGLGREEMQARYAAR